MNFFSLIYLKVNDDSFRILHLKLSYSARNNTILCHLDYTSLCVDFPLECYKFTVILFVAKSKGSLENPKPRYDPPLSH